MEKHHYMEKYHCTAKVITSIHIFLSMLYIIVCFMKAAYYYANSKFSIYKRLILRDLIRQATF